MGVSWKRQRGCALSHSVTSSVGRVEWMAGAKVGIAHNNSPSSTAVYFGAIGFYSFRTHELVYAELAQNHHAETMNKYFKDELSHEHQKFKYEELVQSANAEELMGGVEDAAEGNETHGYIGGIEHLPALGGKWQPGWDFPNAGESVTIKGPDGRMAFTRFPTNAKFSFNSCR